jgi:hypothetical protein
MAIIPIIITIETRIDQFRNPTLSIAVSDSFGCAADSMANVAGGACPAMATVLDRRLEPIRQHQAKIGVFVTHLSHDRVGIGREIELEIDILTGIASHLVRQGRAFGGVLRVDGHVGSEGARIVVEGEVVEESDRQRNHQRDQHPGIANRVSKVLTKNGGDAAELHGRRS